MSTARYLPPVSIAVTIGRLFSGRIRFSGDRVGKTLTMENGEVHTVFREVQVASSASVPDSSMTILKVRFQFARFSPAANRRLSLLPVPIILGMPGFRQKTWTFCEESSYSMGIYQFESPETAEGYWRSRVRRILEKRSVPGTMEQEIMQGVLIGDKNQ